MSPSETGDTRATRDAASFEEYAEQYDAWYETDKGRVLLSAEVACLRPLVERFPGPYLETGVGTGRFAEALGIEYGLDPSPRTLKMARRREVNCVLGRGEQLPFKDACFGGVLMAFSLCFVQAPYHVLSEVRRVLVGGGGLVLGLLLKGTPWADYYARRGTEGHPLYRAARFYSMEEVVNLLNQTGFLVARYRSTLLQEPGLEAYQEEQPIEGYVAGAGFVGIAASRAE